MQTNESEALQSRRTGRKLGLILLAFFLTFATADGFFVYKALTTHSGVVSERAYEIGLHYNKVIAEAKKRKLEKNGTAPTSSHPISTK